MVFFLGFIRLHNAQFNINLIFSKMLPTGVNIERILLIQGARADTERH